MLFRSLPATATTVIDGWRIDASEIKLGKQIGAGNFGTVYRGEWNGMSVAIKQLHADVVSSAEKDAFTAEAERMIHIKNHRNIVMLCGVCEIDGNLALVTEFCDGGSLDQALYGKKPLIWKLDAQVSVAIGTSFGLQHLHHQNIIHRDVAARNVLLDRHRTPKLTDFGMSRANRGDEDDNTTQNRVGPLK